MIVLIFRAVSPLFYACKFVGLAPYSCSSRAVVNFSVGTCRHRIYRMTHKPSEKGFLVKVLFILSLFSISSISISGVIFTRRKVGHILISCMRADAVCQNAEDGIYLCNKKLNISCNRTRSTAHNTFFLFCHSLFLFDAEVSIHMTEKVCTLSESLVIVQFGKYVLFL